jgi:hypothetical protein
MFVIATPTIPLMCSPYSLNIPAPFDVLPSHCKRKEGVESIMPWDSGSRGVAKGT